jgi:hypothetical protein
MSGRTSKKSASNEGRKSANDKEIVWLRELAKDLNKYYLYVLGQARVQFRFSLIVISSVFIIEALWVLINKTISPSLALIFTFNPVLFYTYYQARRTLRKVDEIARLKLAVNLVAQIDNPNVRNSTLSEFVKQLVAPYPLASRKEQKGKDTGELITGIIEANLKSHGQHFVEAAKNNFIAR